jgi:hypothetical protein
MQRLIRLVLPGLLALGLLAASAGATHNADQHFKMEELFTSPNKATNSDLAFWGKHAFVGYYTGSDFGEPVSTGPRGGVRIFDISNPASPRLVRDFACDGPQNDPILWDRNGNGVADLLLLAVDRTMDNPNCGAPRSMRVNAAGQTVRFDANPNGWEGVRVFEMSDNPANPFQTITPAKMQYTDCGAHTITAWTGFANHPTNPRLIVYVSSYPLRPGPTCGQTGSLTATPPYANTTNPYDEDPVVNDPFHRQIQVLEVPLNNPAATREIAQPPITYPGDPDGKFDWSERGLSGLEPAAVACHDITVRMKENIAGGACAEQGQVWEITANGIPNTAAPTAIMDDEFSSGGTGNIPGAVDFFHSVTFDNEGEVVNLVDESFGSGCPTMTNWQARPWHPAATQKSGRMFFTDVDGNFLSEFHVGDLRPNPGETEYCSAHMGLPVLRIDRDLLVNAWYTGGVDVIDFSDATALQEVAYYDPARDSGTWSAYSYTGPKFRRSPGVPIYASDGVENNAIAEGMVVYRALLQNVGRHTVDHLNPQTMD